MICCVGNVSFFVFSGMSLPSQIYHYPTEQEELYSLASLRKVSFNDVTHLKDYRNVSTPIFRLKEELCELPLSSKSQSIFLLTAFCFGSIIFMVFLFSTFCCFFFGRRRFERKQKRIRRTLHQPGDLEYPTAEYKSPALGATSSVAVDAEKAALKATPDSDNPLLPSSVAAGVERGQVSTRISWSPPIYQVFETESGV